MARSTPSTRERIQEVALEMFARQGVQRTSLQDIANRLGITKPALYYHFSSRDDLVRSIVNPLIQEGEELVARHEQRDPVVVSELLEDYFDFHYRHREKLMLVLTELRILGEIESIDAALDWRRRLVGLVFGPEPTLDQAARAIMAFGGIQDCCLQLPDAPHQRLRTAAVDAALTVLGAAA
ncbi:TetR/AcrR family transcriptional regulator [Nocardia sp. NPDC127526]|uniref:TetR/AcrR family transcriptional regulator n=1 Tax=Nocardia sp. NPDC127526 TaxID=3345393 RepID=UPI0036435389